MFVEVRKKCLGVDLLLLKLYLILKVGEVFFVFGKSILLNYFLVNNWDFEIVSERKRFY